MASGLWRRTVRTCTAGGRLRHSSARRCRPPVRVSRRSDHIVGSIDSSLAFGEGGRRGCSRRSLWRCRSSRSGRVRRLAQVLASPASAPEPRPRPPRSTCGGQPETADSTTSAVSSLSTMNAGKLQRWFSWCSPWRTKSPILTSIWSSRKRPCLVAKSKTPAALPSFRGSSLNR